MLTVKHIIWDGGFETLYQAKQVRVKRHEPSCAPSKFQEPIEFIAFDLPNGDVWRLDNGKVFVMNEAGRTVANYEFQTSRAEGAKPEMGKVYPPITEATVGGMSLRQGTASTTRVD